MNDLKERLEKIAKLMPEAVTIDDILEAKDRIEELEAKLAKCEENKSRAYMGRAEKLSEISGWEGACKRLEAKLKLAEDTIEHEIRSLDPAGTRGAHLKRVLNQLREK